MLSGGVYNLLRRGFSHLGQINTAFEGHGGGYEMTIVDEHSNGTNHIVRCTIREDLQEGIN